MNVKVFLFDADGNDKNIELKDVNIAKIKERQFLWIDVEERNKKTLENVFFELDLKNVPLNDILNESERPKIDIFKDFYRFFINSVETKDEQKETPNPKPQTPNPKPPF